MKYNIGDILGVDGGGYKANIEITSIKGKTYFYTVIIGYCGMYHHFGEGSVFSDWIVSAYSFPLIYEIY